jgi:iron complex transport system substrate-binding protein
MGGMIMPNRFKKSKILSLTLVWLSLFFCVFTVDAKTAKTTCGSGPITIIDLFGRTVTFAKPVEKIILQQSGSGGAFMTLAALEGKNFYQRIVGLDPGLKINRMDMWQEFTKSIPQLKSITEVGAIGTGDFSVEQAISLGAEVLIAPAGLKKSLDSIAGPLEAAGIKIVYINYHDQTFENHVKSIRIIGQLIGKSQKTKALIDYYQKQMKLVTAVTDRIAKSKRKTVYIECGQFGPEKYGSTYSKQNMWGAMADQAGLTSIADGIVVNSGNAGINPEVVLSANPDCIFINGSYWPANPNCMYLGYQSTAKIAQKRLEGYLKRDGWDQLTAVKHKKVYSVNHVLSRDIFDFYGVQCLAKYGYPKLFTRLDPDANLKEFFKKFMPFKLSGLWSYHLK